MSEYVLTKDNAFEHERLQLLEAQADPLSIEAIAAAGIGPGSRCLEIGAGAGSIARWLATQSERTASVGRRDRAHRHGLRVDAHVPRTDVAARLSRRRARGTPARGAERDPTAKFWSLTLETMRARIVDARVLTDTELDAAQALLADPEFWDLGPAWVATWGKRPA